LSDADAPVMPLKVLVVDDNVVNHKLAKALLERNGCETYEAENGRQAIELFEKAQPDLVIILVSCISFTDHQLFIDN
jgi:CheY-like chemotaxis protein